VTELVWSQERVLILENELLRVAINLDKGAEVFEFRYKPKDIDGMWHRNAALAGNIVRPESAPNGLDAFFDRYAGGWQESFPVGNSTGLFFGAAMYLHGEVSLLPWQYKLIRSSAEQVEIELSVECVRTPFHLSRRMLIESNVACLRLEETVRNLGGQSLPFAWGHHVAFGPPLLASVTRLDLPSGTIRTPAGRHDLPRRYRQQQKSQEPRLEDPNGESLDITYAPPQESGTFDNFEIELASAGCAAIRNPCLNLGVGLLWDVEVMPFLWEWEVSHAPSGYPLWGRDYLLALEPFNCPIGGLTDPDFAARRPI
jgi:galactose mutarotase-like enzyme